jgi:hypothetical protein
MFRIVLLAAALTGAAAPAEVVERKSGGVRVTRTSNGRRYEITTRDPIRVSRIAASDPDPNVRYAAVMTLADRALLEELAETAPDEAVRQIARQRITVRAVSAAEAAAEKRLAANAGLDPAAAAVVARHDPSPQVRSEAVFRVTSQRLLADIAAYDQAAVVRAVALNRLTDVALLDMLATQSLAPDVRAGARQRLQALAAPRPLSPAR